MIWFDETECCYHAHRSADTMIRIAVAWQMFTYFWWILLFLIIFFYAISLNLTSQPCNAMQMTKHSYRTQPYPYERYWRHRGRATAAGSECRHCVRNVILLSYCTDHVVPGGHAWRRDKLSFLIQQILSSQSFSTIPLHPLHLFVWAIENGYFYIWIRKDLSYTFVSLWANTSWFHRTVVLEIKYHVTLWITTRV